MESSFLLASWAVVHCIDVECPVVLSTTYKRRKYLLLWTCSRGLLKLSVYRSRLHVLGRFEHIRLKPPFVVVGL